MGRQVTVPIHIAKVVIRSRKTVKSSYENFIKKAKMLLSFIFSLKFENFREEITNFARLNGIINNCYIITYEYFIQMAAAVC